MRIYKLNCKLSTILYRLFIKQSVLLVVIVLSASSFVVWYCGHNYNNKSSLISSLLQLTKNGLNILNHNKQVNIENDPSYSDNNACTTLTYLKLAQQCIKKNDFNLAQTYLQKALQHTSEVNMQSIIGLRLARVQLQQKNIDSALEILNKIKGREWTALVENTRGDAQCLKGNYKSARIAYEKALKLSTSQFFKDLVNLKLNSLPTTY